MTNSFYFYALPYIPDYRDTWWIESMPPQEFMSTLNLNPDEFQTDVVIDQLDSWVSSEYDRGEIERGFNLKFLENEDQNEYARLIVIDALSVGNKVVQMDSFNFIANQPNYWVDVMIFGLLSLDFSRLKSVDTKIEILSLIDFLFETKIKGYALITVSSSRTCP